jgi:hypothetical protein
MYAVLKCIPSPFENRIRNSGGTIALSGGRRANEIVKLRIRAFDSPQTGRGSSARYCQLGQLTDSG